MMIPLTEEKKSNYYSQEQLAALNPLKTPRHVAIIPDGNRRWAQERRVSATMGHHVGAEGVTDIVAAARDLGVEHITFYAFSTENWKRSEEEVDGLMHILALMLHRETPRMIDQGIRLRTIGELDPLPEFVRDTLMDSKQATDEGDEINFTLAINYGGRDEILRALNKMAIDIKLNQLEGAITEEVLEAYLDTHFLPDPELVIRTSGEMRMSNFLMWQSSYSELATPDVLWPDFKPSHLYEIIMAYQGRQRRWGM